MRAKRKVKSNKVIEKENKFNFRRHPAGGAVYTSGTHLVGADDSSELLLENSRDFLLRPRADMWWLRKERPLVAKHQKKTKERTPENQNPLEETGKEPEPEARQTKTKLFMSLAYS